MESIYNPYKSLILNSNSEFKELEINPGREDIYQKLGILKGDSRFDKLYKKAMNSELFLKEGFWISVE